MTATAIPLVSAEPRTAKAILEATTKRVRDASAEIKKIALQTERNEQPFKELRVKEGRGYEPHEVHDIKELYRIYFDEARKARKNDETVELEIDIQRILNEQGNEVEPDRSKASSPLADTGPFSLASDGTKPNQEPLKPGQQAKKILTTEDSSKAAEDIIKKMREAAKLAAKR